MFTAEISGQYNTRRGPIVTDYHAQRFRTVMECDAWTRHHWARMGRRRGTVAHVRYTGDAGMVILRTFRRD